MMSGFVVEDWEETFPIAVGHKNGLPEMRNNNIITPLMFEMIKNEHRKNMEREQRIFEREQKILELKKGK